MRPDRVNPEARFAMAPGTAEEQLSRINQHLLYIGRTKWEAPRNRISPRHHSAEKQLAIHPHADQQTAGARRHQGIAGQHLQVMANGD